MELDNKKYRKQRSITRVLLQSKCPTCGQGDMFKDPNPYNIYNFDKMNRYCSNCNMDFENETGFYFGAMYVSYGLCVGMSVMNFAIYALIFGFGRIHIYLIANSIMLLVLWPFIFRLSRVMYLWVSDIVFSGEGADADKA
ncbi:MAG TPA: hypothetical protein VLZ75_03805 [Chitinophagales bacterium]|nr:hypothetical protein [Chitinophagales bacterium]